mmetsp:Transcript_5886/g.14657  ORF Transcript_5886/g.14657 Transcript_5886/m.14657 type:complete len:2020 (-) Transcript_5886:432-6491(-)
MRDSEIYVSEGGALSPATNYYQLEQQSNFGGIVGEVLQLTQTPTDFRVHPSIPSGRSARGPPHGDHARSGTHWRNRARWESSDAKASGPQKDGRNLQQVAQSGAEAEDLAERSPSQTSSAEEQRANERASSSSSWFAERYADALVLPPTPRSAPEQPEVADQSRAAASITTTTAAEQQGPAALLHCSSWEVYDAEHHCLGDCYSDAVLPAVAIALAVCRMYLRRTKDDFLYRVNVFRKRETRSFRVLALLQLGLLLPLFNSNALSVVERGSSEDAPAFTRQGPGDVPVLLYGLFFFVSFMLLPAAASSPFLWFLATTLRGNLFSRSAVAAYFLTREQDGHLEPVHYLQLACDAAALLLAAGTYARQVYFKYFLTDGTRLARTASLAQLLLETSEATTDLHSLEQLERELSARVSYDKRSPEEDASFFGKLSFSWFSPIVQFCYAKQQNAEQLQMAEVPPLPAQDLCQVHYLRLKREWDKELANHPDNPSLTHALTRCFVGEALFGWQGLLKMASDCLHFLNPFLLNTLLRYLADDSTKAEAPVLGWFLALGMCLTSLLQALALTHYFQIGYRCAMHVRSALIVLVFQKSLRLVPGALGNEKSGSGASPEQPTGTTSGSSPSAPTQAPSVQHVTASQIVRGPRASVFQKVLASFLPVNPGKCDYEGSVGQTMNLITADTDRFSTLMPYLNLLWSAPLQLVLCFFFLGYYVGYATFGGLIVMAASFLVSGRVQKRAQALQREVMKVKDERLKIQNELLNAIKMVKLYGWENSLAERVREIRDRELLLQKRVRQWSGVQWLQFTVAPGFVGAATFFVHCIVLGRELDPATAFTALALFSVIGFPLGALPMMLQWLIQSQVAVIRLETFLKKPEVQGSMRVEVNKITGEETVVAGGIGKFTAVGSPPTTTSPSPAVFDHDTGNVDSAALDARMNLELRRNQILQNSALIHLQQADPGQTPRTAREVLDNNYPVADDRELPLVDHGAAALAGAENLGAGGFTLSPPSTVASTPTNAGSALPLLMPDTNPRNAESGAAAGGKSVAAPGGNPVVEYEFDALQWPNGASLLTNPSGHKFHFNMGDFVVVVGPTGSGKTGFLTALLGELSDKSGVTRNLFRGRGVRYCAQSPWVCNKTLRDNVTWGQVNASSHPSDHAQRPAFDRPTDAADREREYENTLRCSALLADIDVLPNGDETQIGDRGVTLSGGQKARVAIARAIFDVNDADVFVFDDVLSAVDAHVAGHLRREVFRGRLRHKCVILATHDEQTARLASKIIHCAKGSGEVSCYDSFEEYRAAVSSEDDESTSYEEMDLEHRLQRMGSNSPPGPAGAEEVNATMGTAVVNRERTRSRSKEAQSPSPPLANQEPSAKDGEKKENKSTPNPEKQTLLQSTVKEEERSQGSVSFDCYRYYLNAMGGPPWIALYFACMISSESCTVMANSWIGHWSDNVTYMASSFGLLVYVGIIVFGAFALFLFILYRISMGQAAARKLHMDCQYAVLRAKMAWLDVTPVGRILNRFAEDTVILDNNLPQTISLNCQWFYRLLLIFVLSAQVSPWTLLLFVPIWVLFLQTQRYYIPSARDLRRLDTVNKSPIFSHFAETLVGLSTVRVHKLEQIASNLNVTHLEKQLQVFFLANSANRWLSLRMQLTGTLLVSGVCFLAIALRSYLAAGIVGLAIMYSLKLTDTLNALNRESADLETQMISVERLKQYVEQIPTEADLDGTSCSSSPWRPTKGRVEFADVSLRYRDELPLVLKNVSLSVPAGTSLGICGRTGSGKSSLLLSLMRMVEPCSGTQKIDGRDVGELGLHQLRKNLMVIPQDPVIFSGSIRFNLDPFRESTDAEMVEALRLARLQDKLGTNLDAEVSEGGGNFSHGERQLLALARAILRKPKGGTGSANTNDVGGGNGNGNSISNENAFKGILLLDEATSALDPELDKQIQSILRTHFHGSTIITIAHRISTIADYNAVAVLEAGRVVEYGDPRKLVKLKAGKFAALASEMEGPRDGGVAASSSKRVSGGGGTKKRPLY